MKNLEETRIHMFYFLRFQLFNLKMKSLNITNINQAQVWIRGVCVYVAVWLFGSMVDDLDLVDLEELVVEHLFAG